MARPIALIDPDTGFCYYCTQPSMDRDPLAQHKVCFRCMRTRARREFLDADGEEQEICQHCLAAVQAAQDTMESTSSLGSLSERLSSSFPFGSSGSAPTPSRGLPARRRGPARQIQAPRANLPSRPSQRSQLSQASQPVEPPPAPEPMPDPDLDGDLEADALTLEDRLLLQKYKAELAKDVMAECSICKERWFDMTLRDGVCSGCFSRDRAKRPEEPLFFSVDNDLDFGDMPEGLPGLSQVEEQLIARVHVHVEVFLYRGQQYKYRGHIVNFLRDIGKVFSQLPRLPRELDIIILRPTNFNQQPHVVRQFRRNFYVKQSNIRAWLDFLITNHPAYRDIVVSEERLSQLPDGESVIGDFPVEDVEPVDIEDIVDEDNDESDLVDEGAVPNMVAEEANLDQLREQIRSQHQSQRPEQPPLQPYIEMGDIRQTPLNEFNRSQALLSWAFPTLYPRGQAKFVSPRMRAITYNDYIRHAMRYRDGRFARHPRFRFVAFNTWMRSTVNAKSSYFVRHTNQNRVDLEELRAAFDSNAPEAQRLLNSIVKHADTLRGTRAYWTGRGHQLTAHVYALGMPALFTTFSPADLHWDSLARHMPRYDEWKQGPEQQRLRISRENLRDNPHIAAFHFFRRYNLFREHVLTPKFGIVDYWDRYEWQARGSSHHHGLYWCTNTLTPDFDVPEERFAFCQRWGFYITALNPQPQRVMAQGEANVLVSVLFEDEQPTFDILSRVVNRVQRHICTAAYCLRRRKLADGTLSAEPVCRFHYPRPQHDEPIVTLNFNPSYYVFDGARNDTRLNGFNRTVSLGWLANTDISPCTSVDAVINYAAKYCSKGETKSKSYMELSRELMPRLASRNPVVSFASKLMNKLISERDWSAQEVCHLLMHLPLQEGSRVVRTVDCRPYNRQHAATIINPENQALQVRSQYQKYLNRSEEWEDLTYFDFLSNIDWSQGAQRWRRFARAKPRVLNYFPRYKPDPTDSQFDDFCRVKLMLSHVHRDPDELLTVDGEVFESYRDAYRYCDTIHEHPANYYGAVAAPVPEEEFEEPPDEELQPREWEELAAELPNRQAETEDIDILGNRDLDLLHSWEPHVGRYPDLEDTAAEFWKLKKADQATAEEDDVQLSPTALDSLNLEQRMMFDLFVHHYEAYLRHEDPAPILLQVDGRGGTGKSHVIRLLSAQLDQLAQAHGKPSPVVRAAPTGVAANNINGSTLHSLLRLPVSKKGEIDTLNATETSNLQAKLKQFIYFIIDEKSMIGLRMLAAISARMGEVWPRFRHEPFGSRCVVLIGDFFQLPPVAERPLFTNMTNLSATELAGRNAYRAFDRTIELKAVVRQQGDEQAGFRDALEGLRHNNPTVPQWRLLSTRVQAALPIQEVASFDDALRIYPRNSSVNDYNLTHLEGLNRPCYQAVADNTGPRASEVEAADAGNLHKKIPLVLGARVMLTENIWISAGLVNGSIGTIHDFAWKTGVEPREEPPFVVLVKFDGYTGPPCFPDRAELAGVVPIFRSRRDFLRGHATCTRTQFPLTIAYAITVHKSQGATLDKAVLDISEKDFQPGLTYVAVSRAKSLQGVMFDTAFDLSALRVTATANNVARAEDDARRRPQHVTPQQIYPPEIEEDIYGATPPRVQQGVRVIEEDIYNA